MPPTPPSWCAAMLQLLRSRPPSRRWCPPPTQRKKSTRASFGNAGDSVARRTLVIGARRGYWMIKKILGSVHFGSSGRTNCRKASAFSPRAGRAATIYSRAATKNTCCAKPMPTTPPAPGIFASAARSLPGAVPIALTQRTISPRAILKFSCRRMTTIASAPLRQKRAIASATILSREFGYRIFAPISCPFRSKPVSAMKKMCRTAIALGRRRSSAAAKIRIGRFPITTALI